MWAGKQAAEQAGRQAGREAEGASRPDPMPEVGLRMLRTSAGHLVVPQASTHERRAQ